MFRKVHPVVERICVTIDGIATDAEAGELLAAVLLRCTPPHSRLHPVSGEPRAPYCMMGACQECLTVVDGVASTPACRTPVRDGMVVQRQQGVRQIADV
jgi:predicted molibdopterin-dependent oxidoreductase YjgC